MGPCPKLPYKCWFKIHLKQRPQLFRQTRPPQNYAAARYNEALEQYLEGDSNLEDIAWTLFDYGQALEYAENDSVFSKNSEITESAAGIYDELIYRYPAMEAAQLYAELTGITLPDAPEAIFPDSYALYPAFPNPFNPVTTIAYDLPKSSDVTLSIVNITGQRVHRERWTSQPAGYYQYQWNAASYASGVYFIRLDAQHFHQSMKVVLMK